MEQGILSAFTLCGVVLVTISLITGGWVMVPFVLAGIVVGFTVSVAVRSLCRWIKY